MSKPHPLVVPLATHMFANGIKVQDACARAGVNPTTWSRWAKGAVPSLTSLAKLHMAIDEIVAEQEQAAGASETSTKENA